MPTPLMPTAPQTAAPTAELPQELAIRVAPLHKLALGISVGIVLALGLAIATGIHMARSEGPYPLQLLDRYFYGYTVSPAGIGIGALWGFFVGFFAGWFFAFLRNLIVGVAFLFARARADLAQGNDILDHI